ncbi:hypothetical protein J2785_007258 [Burkholderia ambifaria]|nr:hypothetical protein [Burkholderia ambifaria]
MNSMAKADQRPQFVIEYRFGHGLLVSETTKRLTKRAAG